MGKRRNDLDICADILKIASAGAGAKKTQIVYRANLNFKIVEGYLGRLKENGLLIVDGRVFRTTGKGSDFLDRYRSLVSPMLGPEEMAAQNGLRLAQADGL